MQFNPKYQMPSVDVAFKLPGVIGIETAIESIPQASCSLREPGRQLLREAPDGAGQLLARVCKFNFRHLPQESQAGRVYWNIGAGMQYPAGAHRGLSFKSDERGMEGIPIIEDGNGELRAGLLR